MYMHREVKGQFAGVSSGDEIQVIGLGSFYQLSHPALLALLCTRQGLMEQDWPQMNYMADDLEPSFRNAGITGLSHYASCGSVD